MRIISGTAKGLKLSSPPPKSGFIRPTSDRSREALFSILGERVHHARVLDLFAGTGALGLEALSRGAESAVFVDCNSVSLKIIEKNIAAFFRCTGKKNKQSTARICRFDLRKTFEKLFQRLETGFHSFDLIFLDPPYDKGLAGKSLEQLASSARLKEDGLIIVEERAKTELPTSVMHFVLQEYRQYGDTGFWLYSQTPHNSRKEYEDLP